MSYPQGPQYPPPQGPPGPPAPYGPPSQRRRSSNTGLVILFVAIGVVLVLVAVVVGVVIIASSSSSSLTDSDGDPVDERFIGNWSGEMSQTAADGTPMGTWHLDLTIDESGIDGQESGLSGGDGQCSWDAYNIDATGSQLTFSYTTSDPDCASSGDVTLDASTDTMVDATITSPLTDGPSDSTGLMFKE